MIKKSKEILERLFGKKTKQFLGSGPVPEDPIIVGKLAEQLRDNPLLTKILDDTKREVLMIWKNSDLFDYQSREMCYIIYTVVTKIESKIQTAIEVAEIELSKLRGEENND